MTTLAQMLALVIAVISALTATGLRAAPDQDLSPADYTGYVLPSGAYGSAMAAGGDWLAVGAPGAASRVLLWKREAAAGGGTPLWVIKQELLWPDADFTTNCEFGRRLAMDATGTRLLIGSSRACRRAHIFRREGDAWTLEGSMHAQAADPDGTGFGETLVLSRDGSVAAVGSPFGVYMTPSTSYVDVFTREPGGWTHATRLTDALNEDDMGSTIAMHGHTLFVGRPGWEPAGQFDSANVGKVDVFDRTSGTGTWAKTREITEPSPGSNHQFGGIIQVQGDSLYVLNMNSSYSRLHEFSISGGFSVTNNRYVSLPFGGMSASSIKLTTDGQHLGLAGVGFNTSDTYFFRRGPDQTWVYEGDDSGSSQPFAYEQWSVLCHEGEFLSGGNIPNIAGTQERVWTVRVGTRVNSAWVFRDRRDPMMRGRQMNLEFGQSLAQEGDWVMAGAPDTQESLSPYRGMVYAYQKTPQGSLRFHSLLPSPTDPAPGETYPDHGTSSITGRHVAMSGGRVAVGWLSDRTSSRGCMWVYAYDSAQDRWVRESTVMLPSNAPSYGYGDSLDLHGDLLAVGMRSNARVYLFRRSGTQWSLEAEIPRPTTPAEAKKESFGTSVALSDTTLVVGAPSSQGGSACFYEKKNNVWTLMARFTKPAVAQAIAGDKFGTLVATAGDRALVSRGNGNSLGSVYQRSATGAWRLHSSLPAGNGSNGGSMAFSGTTAAFTGMFGTSVGTLKATTWTTPWMPSAQSMTRGLALTADQRLLGGTSANTVLVRNLHQRPEIILLADSISDTTEAGVRHLDMGDYLVGAKSDHLLIFAFLSRGLLPARVTAKISGADAADFFLPKSSWDIAPGAFAEGTFGFAPKTTGSKEATLTFSSDAPDEQPYVIVLRAQVVAQAVPVTFTQQPQSQLMTPGQAYLPLLTQAQGTRPFTYRWMLNGSTIPHAISPRFNAGSEGLYQLEITSPTGKVRSHAAALGRFYYKTSLGFEDVPRSLTLQGQTSLTEMKLLGPGLKVTWWRDVGGSLQPLSDGGRISGTSKPVLSIRQSQPGDSGRHVARVTMPDPATGATLSAETPVDVFIVRPLVATLDHPLHQPLALNESVEMHCGFQFDAPKNPYVEQFTVTGLPPGMKHEGKSGYLWGTPTKAGLYRLSITVKLGPFTSAPLVCQLIVKEQELLTPGFYWGMIPVDWGFPLGGSVSMDLRPDGTCTGSIQKGSRRIPFTTRFSLPGLWYSDTFNLPQLLGGAAHTGALRDNQDGRYELTVRPVNSTDLSEVLTLSHLQLIRPLAHPAPPPAEALGKHNFAMWGGGDGFYKPAGAGYGTLAVAADRSIKLSAKLADGSTLTGTGWYVDAVTEGAETRPPGMLLYATDTTGQGSLRGAVPVPYAYQSAVMRWNKLPVTGRTYPNGISEMPLDWSASRYDPLVPGQRLEPGEHMLILSVPYGGTLTHERLTDMSTTFVLSSKLAATFSSPVTTNPARPRLTLDASTGLFTGQFDLQDPDPANYDRNITRSVKFQGIYMPEQQQAFGFFLLPDLPDPHASPPTSLSTSPIRSGSLHFEPVPAPAEPNKE